MPDDPVNRKPPYGCPIYSGAFDAFFKAELWEHSFQLVLSRFPASNSNIDTCTCTTCKADYRYRIIDRVRQDNNRYYGITNGTRYPACGQAGPVGDGKLPVAVQLMIEADQAVLQLLTTGYSLKSAYYIIFCADYSLNYLSDNVSSALSEQNNGIFPCASFDDGRFRQPPMELSLCRTETNQPRTQPGSAIKSPPAR